MRPYFYLVLLAGSLPVSSCSKTDAPPRLRLDLNQEQTLLVSEGNSFSFSLFKEVLTESAPEKNVLISPLSAELALAMTLNGARGETEAAMKSTMGLGDLPAAAVNEYYKKILETLPELDPKVRLNIANSIWYEERFPVSPSFLKTNNEFYRSQVSALDFRDPASKNTINDWVRANTGGKIPTIVDEIGDQDVMFLINALYFNGTWKYSFDPEDSFDALFHPSEAPAVNTLFMRQTGTFNLGETRFGQLIELPYGNEQFSMMIMLPARGSSVESALEQLDAHTWTAWTDNLEPVTTAVTLPKFTSTYERKLNDPLSNLGMEIAFSQWADFTGIAPGSGLLISEVKQKTYITVDEKGTEAAAATSVGIGLTSERGIPAFNANRPFLYMIIERSSGLIVFMGKLGLPDRPE